MPTTPRRSSRPTTKGESRFASGSKSPARGGAKSKSRSRSRTRSPARVQKPKSSPARPATPKQSLSSSRKRTPSNSPSRSTRAETPTRVSARIAAKQEQVEQEKNTTKMPSKAQDVLTTPGKAKVTKTKKYEFGGPFGALFMVLSLPLTILGLNLMCTKTSCTVMRLPVISRRWQDYFDCKASMIYLGWFVFQAVLAALPIGRVVQGMPLRTGNRLSYRCNGFFALLMSFVAFGVTVYLKFPLKYVHDKFIQLAVTGILFSWFLSILLYIKARRAPNNALAQGGNSGCTLYDFFMGRELNPRIGPLDLKFFCELRPGLIGWVMLNLCFIAKDCIENKSPSSALLLVAMFQIGYVADALWFEDSLLTTMDITTDGFGYMLAIGDLAWVPFVYNLQSRYLLEHTQQWRWYILAAFALLNLAGYIIFRGSNSQKNEFRKNPFNPALHHLESIPTPSGKRLLVSGWWGLCRHPNYMGDLIMALAWSLPCGFDSIIPYFYPIYFAALLVHRASRDNAHCKAKYGAAWDRYCERVPYTIIPYVY